MRYLCGLVLLFPVCLLADDNVSERMPGDSARDLRTLEEIYVTARRREESLQDAPLSVSAFGAAQLRDTGVNNIKDLTGVVPNLELRSGNGVDRDANPYIRGVGQRETNVALDSGVGVYLNGIYLARASGALLDVVDVAQVQVLRGPQGTLFGKNTTGGAIIIDTVKPDDSFSGYLDLGGGNFDNRSLRAAVNVPLIPGVLASRFTVFGGEREGYVTNIEDGRDFSNEDNRGLMAQLRWLPADTLTVDTFLAGTRERLTPRGQQCLYVNDERGIPEGEPLLESAVNGLTPHNFKDLCQASQNLPPNRFATDMTDAHPQGRDARADTNTFTVGLTLDWEIGDFGLVSGLRNKHILGYRNTEHAREQDLDAVAIPILTRYEPSLNNTDQYSYELQFSGFAWDDFINFTTGVYFFREKTSDQIEQNLTLGPLAGSLGAPGLVLIGSAVNERSTDNEAFAWYWQNDFNFTEHVTLTLGARWTRETRQSGYTETPASFTTADPAAEAIFSAAFGVAGLRLFQPADACTFDHINSHAGQQYTGFSAGSADQAIIHFFSDGGVLVEPTPTKPNSYRYCDPVAGTGKVTDSAWSPMASLRLQATDRVLNTLRLDDAMLYLTYSDGFRSGAITGRAARVDQEFQVAFGRAKAERVDNFEVGLKLETLNRRLRLNTSVFYMQYKDIQLTEIRLNPITQGPEGVIANASSGEFLGLEMELTALLPWNLRLISSLAVTESDTKDFDSVLVVTGPGGALQEQPVDRSDEPLPLIPDYQAFVNLGHSLSLGDFGSLDSSIQGRYTGKVHRHFDRGSFESKRFIAPEQLFIDASVTWTSPHETVAVRAWVKNLADVDDYLIGGIPLVDFLGAGGQIYAEPRTFGVDVLYRFGD